ncbi:hypothetical protein HZH68_013710 [Vespula germanica]|uniref:Uncharacterized protein n=1 Tax=Vespula germanica TaxID=30212 RepID=A0A834MUT5_VESGE|nr:hypothetical protein HZH68_013710 [Vespula germanica]
MAIEGKVGKKTEKRLKEDDRAKRGREGERERKRAKGTENVEDCGEAETRPGEVPLANTRLLTEITVSTQSKAQAFQVASRWIYE